MYHFLALFFALAVCACKPAPRESRQAPAGQAPAGESHAIHTEEFRFEPHKAVILLPANPTTSAQYAAMELAYHLRMISGVAIPVENEPAATDGRQVLSIGPTDFSLRHFPEIKSLVEWEFFVGIRANNLFAAGGDALEFERADWNKSQGISLADYSGKAIGSCYAVYEFLTLIGFRWYLPGEENISAPASKDVGLRLAKPIRRSTAFVSTSLWPNDLNKKMFWKPGDPPLTTGDLMPRHEVMRWKIRNKVGGQLYQPNHSFADWLPAYGETHPEWFTYKSRTFIRELLKKSDWKYQFNHFGNVCLYKPGVLDQVVSNARLFFQHGRKSPAPHQGSFGNFFAIVLNDTPLVCTTPPDSEFLNRPTLLPGNNGTSSFYVWNFINEVAKQVEKEHPGKFVAGLAYQNYTLPPANLKLRPNVAVTVCSLHGNTTPEARQKTYELIDAWKNMGAGWVSLWEYYNMQRSGWSGVPRIAPVLLGRDVRKVHENGVRSEFMELDTWDADARDVAKNLPQGVAWISPIRTYLNTYIRFRMWDDLNNDPAAILAEHYARFYGPAAKPISDFFELIEKRVTDMSLRGEGKITDETSLDAAFDWEFLAPTPVFQKLETLIQEAVDCADAAPYQQRVGWVHEGIWKNMVTSRNKYLESQKNASSNKNVATPQSQAPLGVPVLAQAPDPAANPDDEPWKSLPWVTLNPSDSSGPNVSTRMKIGYIDGKIYLLVDACEPELEKIRSHGIRDMQVFLDDGIEIFLSTNPVIRHQYFHFIVNTKGVVYDAKGDSGREDVSWNAAESVFHVKKDGGGYRLFAKISAADLATTAPGSETLWYGNIIRNRFLDQLGPNPRSVQGYFMPSSPYWRSMGELRFK